MNKNQFCVSKKMFFGLFLLILLITSLLIANKINKNKQTTQTNAETVRPIISGTPSSRGKWPFVVALYKKKNFYLKTVNQRDHPHTTILYQENPKDFSDLEYFKKCNDYENNPDLIGCPSNVYYRFVCAGSLIDPYWVVTAAHCLRDFSKDEIGIAGGLNDIKNDSINNVTTIISGIEKIIPRRIYEPNVSYIGFDDKDIALIHLTKPIYLPTISLINDRNFFKIEPYGLIMGWGFTKDFEYVGFSIDDLTILPSKNLNEAKISININNSKFNYLEQNYDDKTACFGDSGGPLIVWSNQLNKYSLVGILQEISSEYYEQNNILFVKCNPPFKATSIPYSYDWIERNTKTELLHDGIQPNQGTFIGNPPDWITPTGVNRRR